jgi:predicted transcriptional regulator
LWTVVEWTQTGVNVWGIPTLPLPDVSPEAMTAAIEAAGYFAEHARRMYAMSVPDIVATRALAAKLIAGEELDGKTIRYIYRKRWAGLTTPADVGEAVENLRDAGWLKIRSAPSTTRGRPAVSITVSPKRDRFKMEAHPGDEATAAGAGDGGKI